MGQELWMIVLPFGKKNPLYQSSLSVQCGLACRSVSVWLEGR
jgi:hypothetical protein